jgi:hypothetical protein
MTGPNESISSNELSTTGKLILCIVCSLAISSGSLIMREAEHDDAIAFSPIAASFFTETIKMMVSLVAAVNANCLNEVLTATWRERAILSVPAILYVIMNNLRYILVREVNPGLLQVLWNLKIVVVALIYQFPPFSRRLSGRQWIGALMLVVGSAVADVSQWSSSAKDGSSNSGGTLGLALIAVGLCLAGVAGVSCEYAYKVTGEGLAFPTQAFLLYLHGALLNLLAFLVWEAYGGMRPATPGASPLRFPSSLVHGFDVWSWAAIVTISISG